jgi:hypothetical protein
MKITIDTGSDSKEDIKKAINFLQSFLDEGTQSFPVQESPQTASMMGMFAEDSPQAIEEASATVEVPEEKTESEENKHTLIPY